MGSGTKNDVASNRWIRIPLIQAASLVSGSAHHHFIVHVISSIPSWCTCALVDVCMSVGVCGRIPLIQAASLVSGAAPAVHITVIPSIPMVHVRE
jgi:hypothetical protein